MTMSWDIYYQKGSVGTEVKIPGYFNKKDPQFKFTERDIQALNSVWALWNLFMEDPSNIRKEKVRRQIRDKIIKTLDCYERR